MASEDVETLAAEGALAKTQRWPPMESNPPILSTLGHALGLNEAYGFRDVMGYDPELFFLLPDEIFSIIQLFPSSVKTPGSEEDQTANLSPFFLNQIPALDDACGTIALVHSLLNQRERLGLSSGILIDYFNRVKELSPVVRGNSLASDPKIYELHCKQSAQGQTEVPEDGVSSGHHFVCFVPFQKGDERYVVELDGCKRFPTLHQSYTVDEELGADKSFAQAAFAAIKKAYIDPNPGVEDFATIAFGTAPVDEDD